MTIPKSVEAYHNKLKRDLHSDTAFGYKLKVFAHQTDEDLNRGIIRSPNSWAVSCEFLGYILKKYAGCTSDESLKRCSGFYGMTPKRVLTLMRQSAEKAKSSVDQMRASGVNPQANVTVWPHLEKANKAIDKWNQSVRARNSRSALSALIPPQQTDEN